jgi:hypothetical protein
VRCLLCAKLTPEGPGLSEATSYCRTSPGARVEGQEEAPAPAPATAVRPAASRRPAREGVPARRRARLEAIDPAIPGARGRGGKQNLVWTSQGRRSGQERSPERALRHSALVHRSGVTYKGHTDTHEWLVGKRSARPARAICPSPSRGWAHWPCLRYPSKEPGAMRTNGSLATHSHLQLQPTLTPSCRAASAGGASAGRAQTPHQSLVPRTPRRRSQ